VAQIKVTHGTFICAQIEVYEYTNRVFSVDVEHYSPHSTWPLFFYPPPPHVKLSDRFHFCWHIIAGECRLPVLTTIPSLSTFRRSYKPRLTSADLSYRVVRCSVLDPTKMNTTMPPFCSLSRVTWGCAIEIVVAARSVVQTASFAKRVSKSPVGIVNF